MMVLRTVKITIIPVDETESFPDDLFRVVGVSFSTVLLSCGAECI